MPAAGSPKIYSLFKSDSDPETEKKWDELEKKYGVVNALI